MALPKLAVNTRPPIGRSRYTWWAKLLGFFALCASCSPIQVASAATPAAESAYRPQDVQIVATAGAVFVAVTGDGGVYAFNLGDGRLIAAGRPVSAPELIDQLVIGSGPQPRAFLITHLNGRVGRSISGYDLQTGKFVPDWKRYEPAALALLGTDPKGSVLAYVTGFRKVAFVDALTGNPNKSVSFAPLTPVGSFGWLGVTADQSFNYVVAFDQVLAAAKADGVKTWSIDLQPISNSPGLRRIASVPQSKLEPCFTYLQRTDNTLRAVEISSGREIFRKPMVDPQGLRAAAGDGSCVASFDGEGISLMDTGTGLGRKIPGIHGDRDATFTEDSRMLVLLPPLKFIRFEGDKLLLGRASNIISVVNVASSEVERELSVPQGKGE